MNDNYISIIATKKELAENKIAASKVLNWLPFNQEFLVPLNEHKCEEFTIIY